MRIIAISDTHGWHNKVKVPAGDLLIHAGDFTNVGEDWLVENFNDWLGTLPHRHKIVIAGNHEIDLNHSLITNALYLEDTGTTINGLKFWGSPWQPAFNNWAYNLDTAAELQEKWALIPEDTDVLITHVPPWGTLDRLPDSLPLGCQELAARLEVIRPKAHFFGHIHSGYGMRETEHTVYINAAILDEHYMLANDPIEIEIDP